MKNESSSQNVNMAVLALPAVFAFWGMVGVLAASFLAGVMYAVAQTWASSGAQAFLPSAKWAGTMFLASVAVGLHYAAVESVKAASSNKGKAAFNIRTVLILVMMGAFATGAVQGLFQDTLLERFANAFPGSWVLSSIACIASIWHLGQEAKKFAANLPPSEPGTLMSRPFHEVWRTR